ncbi:putative ribonuclease H protein [Glycine soja]
MLLLLYRISDQQKQIIMNMGNNTNGGWEWKLSWRRALFDSEIQMADNFLGELSQQQIQPNTEDRCSWKHDQTGYYSTKSGYDLIWEAQMGANQNLDFVDIWKLKIPNYSPWWKHLKNVFQPHHRNCISNNLKWKLGDGNTIKFWKDKWREEDDLSLQEKYPTLFQVSTQLYFTLGLGSTAWRKTFTHTLISGLKINYAKSKFGCLGKSVSWCREAANYLNCGQLGFPFSYLGIPVGSSSKSWNDLRSVFQQHHNNSLINNFRWKVGDGSRLKFWKDKWREGDLSLKDKYLSLYNVSTQQNHLINSMGILVDNRWEWKFQWRRNLFDHEVDMAAAFMADIAEFQIQPASRDLLLWGLDTGGPYSTKAAYSFLKDGDSQVTEDSDFKSIWNLKIPPRASAFSWRLFKNRIPTKVNLRRRHVELPSYNCPLCDEEEETAGHILYSCIKTRTLWWETMSWVNRWQNLSTNTLFHLELEINCEKTRSLWWETMRWINRVGSYSIDPKNHFLQFTQWNSKDSTNKRWEFLWLALSFSIWYHRNAKIFKNQSFTPEKVMDDALFHTWSWIKCVEKDFQMHFNFWSTNLKDVLS